MATSQQEADRVVVSYRAPEAPASGDGFEDDHIVHENVHERPFRTYLGRAHEGSVAVGDEWAEFVNCGCGSTTDVLLRVEDVSGGDALGESTEIRLVRAGEQSGPAGDAPDGE
jgi:hypothetical protein